MRSKRPGVEAWLRAHGHAGLWHWAMDQRGSVRPPNWDELASRLGDVTDGAVRVKGDMLRKWLISAELERTARADQ